jgi:hypothetical protein
VAVDPEDELGKDGGADYAETVGFSRLEVQSGVRVEADGCARLG